MEPATHDDDDNVDDDGDLSFCSGCTQEPKSLKSVYEEPTSLDCSYQTAVILNPWYHCWNMIICFGNTIWE